MAAPPGSSKKSSEIDWYRIPLRLNTGVLCGFSRLPGAGAVWRPGPSWKLEGHDLWVILQGGGVMCWGKSGSVPFARGTCLWLRPDMRRGLHARVTSAEEVVNIYMHFDTLRVAGVPKPFVPPSSALPPRAINSSQPEFFEQVASMVALRANSLPGFVAGASQAGDLRQATLLLRTMIIEYVREARAQEEGDISGVSARHRAVILRAVDEMRKNFRDIDGMDSFAARYGFERHYFSRIFRRVTGLTPSHMLIKFKVEEACRLLRRSGMDIGEIAEALGYSSLFFFSRQFKEITGHSPRAYRRGG